MGNVYDDMLQQNGGAARSNLPVWALALVATLIAGAGCVHLVLRVRDERMQAAVHLRQAQDELQEAVASLRRTNAALEARIDELEKVSSRLLAEGHELSISVRANGDELARLEARTEELQKRRAKRHVVPGKSARRVNGRVVAAAAR